MQSWTLEVDLLQFYSCLSFSRRAAVAAYTGMCYAACTLCQHAILNDVVGRAGTDAVETPL